jgi:hypothetical protein
MEKNQRSVTHHWITMDQVEYLSNNNKVMDRNSSPYLWVEIHILIQIYQFLNEYPVPVGFDN